MTELLAGILAGEERAVARGLTWLERFTEPGQQLLQELRRHGRQAPVTGITGTPGSGKSTLVDALIARLRAAGETVAVLAIDPSSPYSGGAILGDRIRMMRWHDDPGVFIRSLASRGQLGGLSAATLQSVALLAAAGFGHILIETVGVGQSEVDIAQVADTTVLVLTPGQGDGVQAFKAGVMEIADIFVVNKADHPGVDILRREIAALLTLGSYGEADFKPQIISTIATTGEGVDKLYGKLLDHRRHLDEHDLLAAAESHRTRAEVLALVERELQLLVQALPLTSLSGISAGTDRPADVARRLLQQAGSMLDRS